MSERDALVRMTTNDISATSAGVIVTASGTHTKGSYVDGITAAALTHNVHELYIAPYGTAGSGVDTGYSLDVAIGAAASEVIIIPDILVGFRESPTPYRFPVFIPAGTRIALRGQSVASSDVTGVIVHAAGGSPWGNPETAGGGTYTTYGFTAGTTRGIQPSASGSINVKGAWSQITASTTRDHSIIVPSFQMRDSSGPTGSPRYRVDIGVGGAGSEQVIIPDIFLRGDSIETMIGPIPPVVLLRKIPSGSRLAVRIQCELASDANVDAVVHCA